MQHFGACQGVDLGYNDPTQRVKPLMKATHPTSFIRGVTLWLFAGVFFALPAYALDREVATEIQRLESAQARADDRLQTVLQQLRGLERKMDDLQKKVLQFEKAATTAADSVERLSNTDLANLTSAHQALSKQLQSYKTEIEAQAKDWTWGSNNRDCEDGAKHQQIRSMQSADRKYTLRYLCFDGRLIHLGTDVNLPPVE